VRPNHRHEDILARLRVESRVFVSELAEGLRVSEETIRRDLQEIETEGLLRRIHGGAILPKLNQEQPILVRSKLFQREKAKIATLATRFVAEGMSLFLDTGTTTLVLARRLVSLHSLSVATNSLDIALLLGRNQTLKVTVTPGTVRPNDNALVGYRTIEHAEQYFFDIAFMGIAAIDKDRGFMDYEEDEAQLRRTLIRQSRVSVFLADHSKFGRIANVRTCGIGAVDKVISDRRPPEAFAKRFAEERTEVIHE
jgi:DeoR family glycerol-3-phosphate regulon repressor